MSQNQYCNNFLLFILFSISFGKVLIPEPYSNSSEILIKKNKFREYYEINNSGIEYVITGPAELKIFSKAAFPKKTTNKTKQFDFHIIINGITTESNNIKKIDYKTFSPSHPMHVYTYSAKDVIVLPSGYHNIKIKKKSIFDPPILVRVSRTGRKSKKSLKEEFKISNSFTQYTLKSIDNTLIHSYYLLDNSNPLFLNEIEGLLEFNLRGLHDIVSDIPKIIKMTLDKNEKHNTRYHILSIPHPSKTVSQDNRIPSRLNKIYIQSNNDDYLFHIEDSKFDLLVKINKIIK